ncbi:MAG: TolC family protein, partial [Leptospirales bacterium]
MRYRARQIIRSSSEKGVGRRNPRGRLSLAGCWCLAGLCAFVNPAVAQSPDFLDPAGPGAEAESPAYPESPGEEAVATDDLESMALGLADAERIALTNNFDLRVLNMERDIAEDAIDSRLRDFFPSLSFSYRRNRTIARRDFDNGNHSVQVSLSQPVFDGGRTQLAYEVSKIDARLARERITESKNQLRFQVRQQYLQLVQEKENIAIARAAYESARATLARATVEHRQGAITELDFQEIRTEFDRRGLELEQRTLAYENGRVDFAQLLRVAVDPELNNRPDVKGLDL